MELVLPNAVPTATQLLTATQDTPLSEPSVAPLGSGGAGPAGARSRSR